MKLPVDQDSFRGIPFLMEPSIFHPENTLLHPVLLSKLSQAPHHSAHCATEQPLFAIHMFA